MRSGLADDDVVGRRDDLAAHPRVIAQPAGAPRIRYAYWAGAIICGLLLWAGVAILVVSR